jgi:hypothetical protein
MDIGESREIFLVHYFFQPFKTRLFIHDIYYREVKLEYFGNLNYLKVLKSKQKEYI